MSDETFRSRLIKLLQKSRKALRLYTSMEKATQKGSEFQDLKIQEWKAVNLDLVRTLTELVEEPDSKRITAQLFKLRDRCYSDWRLAEGDLHKEHRALLHASEASDFAKACSTSKNLISLQARVQALQAAHHEIQSVIDQSKLGKPVVDLAEEDELFEVASAPQQTAKIIPLRRKIGVK